MPPEASLLVESPAGAAALPNGPAAACTAGASGGVAQQRAALPASVRAAAAPPTVDTVLDLIGATPMLRVRGFDTGPCELFLKLENFNPGGSVKDRIALSMVEAAEAEGRLRPGGRIFEATAGNTGLALALVAARRGYRLTVVVPDKMSDEKISSLRSMGAEVVLTRSDVGKGHPEYYQDLAERLAAEAAEATGEPTLYINQFANPANPRAHLLGTGPEIWEQMGGRVDAFVAGVGSGGTMAGVGAFLRQKNPSVELVLADPQGSVLAPLLERGECGAAGSWLVEGIGEDFVPPVLDCGGADGFRLRMLSKAYTVTDGEAFEAARQLLLKEGVLGGSSAGALLAAALRYCREQTAPKRVVTIVCDSGARYLSKQFNDHWMRDNGFVPRAPTGDVRDLIARRHLLGEDVWAAPGLPVEQAIRRMRAHGISQMAVVSQDGPEPPAGAVASPVGSPAKAGAPPGAAAAAVAAGAEAADEAAAAAARKNRRSRVVGILDESDLLLALLREGPGATSQPVSRFMEARVETVPPTASLADVLPVLRAGRVAVVAGEGGAPFYGLVTNIDVINHLRKLT